MKRRDPAPADPAESDACLRARGALAARLYGEEDERGSAALDEHLSACPACRAEGARLQAARAALSSWKVPTAEQVDTRRLAAEVRARARLARRAWRPAWIGAAAAVAAFFLLASTGADASIEAGRVSLSFALPRSEAPARAEERRLAELEERLARAARGELEERLAALRSEHAAALAGLEELCAAERSELARGFTRVRSADQRLFAVLLEALVRRTENETDRTREAIVELAAVVAHPQ